MEAPMIQGKASNRPLMCDACGEEIKPEQESYLMRKPEDGETHTVHEHCIRSYGRRLGGAWEVIPVSSPMVTLYL